ncbi:Fasciclin-domain-containing protein [Rozella allomycis CSF55]|uniref:FAS1 domain-containing protein n=1 Tax=Rozella allomycis (strain CSF55) TaxID=988480 RepID=A0A075APE7_ROZAC|nr:FAS1 domain-containing protein [Rozella allomycis CSF55]RKP19065.1 Fasciclin-domain-containing protein [Rozella allomycis CSF55]|eukprot:EPZ31951.1 FAS1 domain-containing protein [Rozella allomycis CSF55]
MILFFSILYFSSYLALPHHWTSDHYFKSTAHEKNILHYLKNEGNYSSFYDQIKDNDQLTEILQHGKDLLVFVPTNEAFKTFVPGFEDKNAIFSYHIASSSGRMSLARKPFDLTSGELLPSILADSSLKGGHQFLKVYLNEWQHGRVYIGNERSFSKVLGKPTVASNGMIFLIDSVLLPPYDIWRMINDIQFHGHLTNVVTMLEVSGLANELEMRQGLTFLAPTDEAFERLGPSAVRHLLSPTGKPLLRRILMYHFVPRETYYSHYVQTGDTTWETMLYGKPIQVHKISFQGERHFSSIILNEESRIIYGDVLCSNGVAHIIDNVLIPSWEMKELENI